MAEPGFPSWMRWAGGALLAFVLGAMGWRVARGPTREPTPEADGCSVTIAPASGWEVCPRAGLSGGRGVDPSLSLSASAAPAPEDRGPLRPLGMNAPPLSFPGSRGVDTPPTDPARVAARAAAGLPPEPDTGRALRQRIRAQAAADPAGFPRWAGERLIGNAPQEEKTAILLAARERDAAEADRLFALALDAERTSDAAFRETAAQLLLGRCARDPEALRRAYASIAANDRAPEDLRVRAAQIAFALLPEDDIERFVADAERRLPPAVVGAALRGLARNPAPRARERLREAAVGRWWDPELQALAAGDNPVPVAEGE